MKSPPVIWLLGLSGAGKSTLAQALLLKFQNEGRHVELLDGDVMRARTGANGYTRTERLKHLRSMADLAASLSQSGNIVIAAFITPYEEARTYLRHACPSSIVVWVATPIEECERRDTKGLYARARRGEIQNFTGLDDPFESPQDYDLKIETIKAENETAEYLWKLLKERF